MDKLGEIFGTRVIESYFTNLSQEQLADIAIYGPGHTKIGTIIADLTKVEQLQRR